MCTANVHISLPCFNNCGNLLVLETFSQFSVAVRITEDISTARIESLSKLPPYKNKHFLCVTFRNSPEPVWQCMTMFVDLLWITSRPKAQTKSKSHHIHLHNSLTSWFWRSLETPLVFISGERLINSNGGRSRCFRRTVSSAIGRANACMMRVNLGIYFFHLKSFS